MSRCHKDYYGDLDIRELFARFKFESRLIEETYSDIEKLLRDIQRSFCQKLERANKHETVRNLWLGQLKGDTRSLAFQNVASAFPPVAPVAPAPPTPPTPLAPPVLPGYVEIEIQRINEQIRIKQTELNRKFTLAAIILINFLLGEEEELEANRLANLFGVLADIEGIRLELQALRDDIVLLEALL